MQDTSITPTQQPGADGLVSIGSAFNSNNNSNPYGLSQVQPQQQPQQPKGNWFERALPTIGGIAGSLLGTLIPIPGVGTVAGGAAGGALGQELENELTGTKGSTLAAGVENAVGGALGGVGGKVLSSALGTAGKLAENATTSAFMRQAGNYVDKNTANYFTKAGVTSFDKAAQAAPLITGATGVEGKAGVTNALENAIQASKARVNLTNVSSNYPQMLQNKLLSLKNDGVKIIRDDVNNAFTMMAKDSGYNVSRTATKGAQSDIFSIEPGALSNMKPGAVYNQAKQFQSKGYELINQSTNKLGETTDSQGYAAGNFYIDFGNQLEEHALGIQEGGTPLAITDADKATLQNAIAPVKNIDSNLHAQLTKDLNAAQNWKDVRSTTQPYVQISKASQALEKIGNKTPGLTPSDIALGTAGNIQGPKSMAQSILGSLLTGKTASAAEGAGLNKFAQLATNPRIVGSKAAGQVIKPGDKKLLGALTQASRVGGTVLGNVPNMVQASGGGATNMNQQQQGMGAQQQPITELFKQLLAQEQAGGGISPNGGQLISALQSLAAPAQQTQMLGQLQGGLGAGFANAGGAQGTLGGLETNLTGLLPGTAANQYQNLQNSYASLLQQLYGIKGGAGLTPQFTQQPGTAGIAAGVAGL